MMTDAKLVKVMVNLDDPLNDSPISQGLKTWQAQCKAIFYIISASEGFLGSIDIACDILRNLCCLWLDYRVGYL
jgi:hypothetical protein